MNKNFTEENIKKIVTWKGYIDQGYYGNSKDIVETYNEVFNGYKQAQPYTNCGSCLRRCVLQMWGEYQEYLEEKKREEEKLKALEVIDGFMTEEDDVPKPKRGRPKKEN